MEKIKKNWYLIVVIGFVFIQAMVFLIFRKESYIAIHDNLDLFVAHLQIMKLSHAFFTHDTLLPMLGGISRDTFGSEFSLYNILYFLLPNFAAYLTGYFLKIGIGFFSFLLLARDVYKEKYVTYKPVLFLLAIAFGLIPVFPTYGIAFTSIPLVIYLLRRIYREPKWYLFLLLFAYPFVSYFSYFGFFILGYMVCSLIILWVKDKKFPKWIALSVIVLSLGYVGFEYRLFKQMLFESAPTIRAGIAGEDLAFGEVVKSILSVFTNTIFHAQDSHMYVVLPVCVVGILMINFFYIKKKTYRKIVTDTCNLTLLFILFNCIVYGLYDCKGFRDLFELILPPLKGFQFNRTLYFNSFLWYALLFLVLKRLYDTEKTAWKKFANVIALIAVCIVMLEPQVYNDFYSTCYNQAYKILKKKDTSTLNYREFYSEKLFAKIKEDIGYQSEWAVAYGMHPAVLQYNGIATLDGYLGLYTEEYKKAFRSVIAPALEQSEEFKAYFDDWGARAYLYSGSGENTFQPLRELTVSDHSLYMNTEAFKKLGGTYLFSRIELDNSVEQKLILIGTYTDESSPYTIYVYQAK